MHLHGQLRYGTCICINNNQRSSPASPYSGVKLSSLGHENDVIWYEKYTELQRLIANFSNALFDWFAEDRRGK